MKRPLILCMVIVVYSLLPGTAFAIGYCKDVAPTDPIDKTFDDEWTLNVGGKVEFDLYLNDVPEPLTSVVIWVSYDITTDIFPMGLQVYDGVNGPPGPWDPALTSIGPPCGGLPPCPTGFYVGNTNGAEPDEDGDIIICRIRVHSEYEGDAEILVQVFPPEIDTVIGKSGTVYDPQISPNTITIHQIIDSDSDGIPDDEDNCSVVPNGYLLGTCTEGTIGSTCINDLDCGVAGFCSMNQEDTYPPQDNGIGDACDCEGDFDCDADCDGTDAATLKADFGRSVFNSPCDGLNIFTVGTNGTILHYDGSTWAEMETGTTESLRDVWGASKTDVFAVGGETILHYNGTIWSPISIGTDSYLLDVWGSGANDLFVTGWDGDIFHYNGINWDTMDSGGTYFLYSIWGSAADDVFVSSYGGFIYHYDGTSWETMTSGTAQDLFAIGGTSSDDVFAVGRNGTLLHYEGTSWQPMDSGLTTGSLFGIWGTAPDDIYVVGSFGTILHYDGTGWLPMASGTTASFNSIWGSGTDNIFAVGDQGTILHYDGTSWSPAPGVPYVISSLTGIWGISEPPCQGDFDCDNDVDGTDAALFKADFGRSSFENPCPACAVEEWCVYP